MTYLLLYMRLVFAVYCLISSTSSSSPLSSSPNLDVPLSSQAMGRRPNSREMVFRRRIDIMKARKAALEALTVEIPVDRQARVTIPRVVAMDDNAVEEEESQNLTKKSNTNVERNGYDEEANRGPGSHEIENEEEIALREAELEVILRVHREKQKRAKMRQRFTLRAEREALKMARERVYEYLLIAVRLPDGARLEGRFRPDENVDALYAFVDEHLQTNLRRKEKSLPYSFRLFSARPQKSMLITGTNQTLVEARLVTPASLVHFEMSPELVANAAGVVSEKFGSQILSHVALSLESESFPSQIPRGRPLGLS